MITTLSQREPLELITENFLPACFTLTYFQPVTKHYIFKFFLKRMKSISTMALHL